MLYSTLLVAASAFTGFAAAQNNTQYQTPIPCCVVPASQVNSTLKSEWCNANQNTCVDLCGGQGQIASGGNDCDDSTLNYTCKCSNGTSITGTTMGQYQQSVPALMCQFWYGKCVEASGSSASLRFSCEQAQKDQCGNKTTIAAGSVTSSARSSGTPTASRSGSGGAASSGGASPAASPAAAAGLLQYSTPVLAGGLMAFFGIAL